MSSKSEGRVVAREVVAACHEAQLAELVHRVGEAVDQFRAGELDVFEADQALFPCSRAATELWKFCNLANVELTASLVSESPPTGWWDRDARTRR